MNGEILAPRPRRWYERFLPFAGRQLAPDQSRSTVEERSAALATNRVVPRVWESQDGSSSLTAEQLQALENRDVPSVDRVSDQAEARADEKREFTTSFNFPFN